MSDKQAATPMQNIGIPGHSEVFSLRGYWVMPASEVARVFDVETREIVQNIKRNNRGSVQLFPEKYAFQISQEEMQRLTSLGVISKPGRGGSRALPWVVTRKGTIRLATIMKVPKAIEAADVFVDIFDEVLAQIVQGKTQIRVQTPSRVVPDEEAVSHLIQLREKIAAAIDDLLNTVIDSRAKTTLKDELGNVVEASVGHIKEWLRSRKIGNEKIAAETCLILEKARDMYERRQSELAEAMLDRERKSLENFEKKIDLVEKLLEMHRKLEPNSVVGLLGKYAQSSLYLPEKTDLK